MKRRHSAAIVLVLAIGVLALSGCAGGASSGSDMSKVWGYVAAPNKAQLDVAEQQMGVNELVVKRVLSPTDGWIVVHADVNGQPGMQVGLAHVKRGESLGVKVPLKDLTTPKVIVALHADKGTPGTFDFEMMNKEMSPDRPFFVNGSELAKTVTVRAFGVKADKASASLEASAQPGAAGQIVISRVNAPTDAWLVVHTEKNGVEGQIIGLAPVRSGETSDVIVPLQPFKLTPNLIVVLHADKGDPGVFEYDMNDTINSVDQPFVIGDKEVSVKVSVR